MKPDFSLSTSLSRLRLQAPNTSAQATSFGSTRRRSRLGSGLLLILGFIAGKISHVTYQNVSFVVEYGSSTTFNRQTTTEYFLERNYPDHVTFIEKNQNIKPRNLNNYATSPPTTTIDLMGIQPRIWEPFRATHTICFKPPKIRYTPGNDNKFPITSMPFDRSFATNRGIIFLKPMKVGGSTAAGVNLRLAKNMAERLTRDYPFCENNFDHAVGWMMKGRKRHNSFLWTLLRDPAKRAISAYYHFHISRYGKEPSIDYFKAVMANQTDYYLKVHAFDRFPSHGTFDHKAKSANDIMMNYDFMAITERFDESMVVLQMLLHDHNVTLGDMLYVKAKSNGGFDDGGYKGKCTFIQKALLTPDMKDYMATEEFRKITEWDEAFYAAANRSLDMTIEELGREEVNRKVELYRLAQSVVKQRCAAEARLPCSATGIKRTPNQTNCLFSDSGCAYECLDALATENLIPMLT